MNLASPEHSDLSLPIEKKDANRLASEIIRALPSGMRFDARRAINAQPELIHNRAAFMCLAHEEYCRELEAGNQPDRESFAERFPEHHRAVLELLEAEDVLRETFPPMEWPEVGETFRGFNLLSDLGRGAFSRVFLAEENEVGNRRVVVKICPFGDHEANILGQLEHPNIG